MPPNGSLIWNMLASAGRQALAGGATSDWNALRRVYDYPAGRRLDVGEEMQSDPDAYVTRLSFPNSESGVHHGIFMRPKAKGRYPCVLLLHALTSDKDAMVRLFGRPLAAHGFASLALDLHLHGERRDGYPAHIGPMEYLQFARENVVEYREALDYLQSRPDVDSGRIGLMGYSLGGMMGAILAAVDERIRACVLMVAGDMVRLNEERIPAALRGFSAPISPSRFVEHIAPRPVMFINGRADYTVPRAAAELLHEAAQEPKEVVWSDAGHYLPAGVCQAGGEWLIRQLGA